MASRARNHPGLFLILMAFVAFVAPGMPDGLLGVAWPAIRGDLAFRWKPSAC